MKKWQSCVYFTLNTRAQVAYSKANAVGSNSLCYRSIDLARALQIFQFPDVLGQFKFTGAFSVQERFSVVSVSFLQRAFRYT